MDPLSITASVITIVTLTGQLISLGYSYTSGVSDCPKELHDLSAELVSFSTVLEAVKRIYAPSSLQNGTAPPSPSSPPSPPPLVSGLTQAHFDDCAAQLQKLLNFLQGYKDPGQNRMRKAVKRLMWPLKEQETKEWIARIEGYKGTFSLALSADGL